MRHEKEDLHLSNEDLKPKSDQEMESDSMESQKPWKPMKLTYTGEAKTS